MSNRDSNFVDGISVVIPCFRSDRSLAVIVEQIKLALVDLPHEILLIDDFSPPQTWDAISKCAEVTPEVRGFRLSKNSGQHTATLFGVSKAKYSITVTIDDDLQNPPSCIPALVNAFKQGHMCVYGYTPSQSQSKWRRLSSRVWWRVLRWLSGVKVFEQISSFRCFRTTLLLSDERIWGRSTNIDAILLRRTSSVTFVQVPNNERTHGGSTYSFKHLLKHAFDVYISFSPSPLRFATVFGVMFSFVSFGLFTYTALNWLFGDAPPGYTSIAGLISLLGGLNLLALSAISSFVARIYERSRYPLEPFSPESVEFRTVPPAADNER